MKLSFEPRARDGKSSQMRIKELAKEEIQYEKNYPRELEMAGTGNESLIPKSIFECQLQADSRNGKEWKCKFCGNLFVSKGALSYHMTSEQCL